MSENENFQAGYASYPAYTNPWPSRTDEHDLWDMGYWAAHDDSYVPDTGGIEEGYGDWWMEAEAARWDDDPSPYDGTYSEM
jgi:hypothetical protein